MKVLLLSTLLAFTATAAQAEATKTTLIPKLGAADIKVKFTSSTTIPAGAQFISFPTTANTKNCELWVKSADATNDRRIKAGVEKLLKYNAYNALIVQGESALYYISCKPNGASFDLSTLTIQDIENSAGGTMSFTVTAPVPVDITE